MKNLIGIESIFLTVAAIIFAGFLGNIVFKKTKISDVLLLMIIGLFVGPLLAGFDPGSLESIKNLAPFFAALVLMMLLFESGLKLNFFKVIGELKSAFIFTLLIFVASVGIVSAIMLLLGWSLPYGIILGTIIGGTSSAIVIPLVQRVKAREETKIFLGLESAITDVLCIIVAIALIQITLNPSAFDLQNISHNLAGAFSIAIVLGFAFAIVWLGLLRDVKAVKETQYLLTIAVLFSVFFLAEFVHSNGTIAAFVFGLVLGNSKEIMRFLKMRETTLDTNISLFQGEISFFLRTFFFIYIGIILDFKILTMGVALVSIGLAIALFLARLGVTKFFCRFFKAEKEDRSLIAVMLPRGLAAAVLASYPLTMGLDGNIGQQIIQIAFLVIFVSNAITTIGVFWNDKKNPLDKQAEKKAEIMEEIKIATAPEKDAKKTKQEK